MPKILIAYYTRTGNTEKMARLIEEGVKEENIEVDVKKIPGVTAEELRGYDAIIMGSPTYYGSMAAEIKQLLDESVKFHGRLTGKVGAAFSSAANIGGGNETTILDILNAFLIHGMIIQGDAKGDHYGPVSIGAPDERVRKQCVALGRKVAILVRKLS
jgi:NAD(P)H dehydrogenase (quinone)